MHGHHRRLFSLSLSLMLCHLAYTRPCFYRTGSRTYWALGTSRPNILPVPFVVSTMVCQGRDAGTLCHEFDEQMPQRHYFADLSCQLGWLIRVPLTTPTLAIRLILTDEEPFPSVLTIQDKFVAVLCCRNHADASSELEMLTRKT